MTAHDPTAPVDDETPGVGLSRSKRERKDHEESESPDWHQDGDSDFTSTYRRPKMQGRRHNAHLDPDALGAVYPGFHGVANAIYQDPLKYKGAGIWLLPRGQARDRVFEASFQLDSLEELDIHAMANAYDRERQATGERLLGFLYWRVSTREQGAKGLSLSANLSFQLKKAARHGVTIAAVFVDVDSGGHSGRKAWVKVLDAVRNHPGATVIVPALHRAHRDEGHFIDSLREIDKSESCVLYGIHYTDYSYHCLAWRKIESRPPAIDIVRSAERYQQDTKRSVDVSWYDKLCRGCLTVSKKDDTFVLYNLVGDLEHFQDNEQGPVKVKDAKERWEFLKRTILEGYDDGDPTVLDRLVDWARDVTGKEKITRKQLLWELRVGWIKGINRRSPYTKTSLWVPYEAFRIEEDDEVYHEVVRAADGLERLRTRAKHRNRVGPKIPEIEKAKASELAVNEGSTHGYVYCCFNGHDPEPMVSKGAVKPKDGGEILQDEAVCPVCDGEVRNAKGKKYVPPLRHLKAIRDIPNRTCQVCYQFATIQEEFRICFPDGSDVVVEGCAHCADSRIARHLYGPTTPVLGGPNGDGTIQGETVLGPGRFLHDNGRPLEYEFATMPPHAPKGTGPWGKDSIWNGNILVPTTGLYSDVGYAPVGKRLENALRRAGLGVRFNAYQLRAIGLGGVTFGKDWDRVRNPFWSGLQWARERMEAQGISLKVAAFKGMRTAIYWLEPLAAEEQTPRGDADIL